MNRISTSPMVLRIVAFAIAAMMMLVIAFSAADMSDAKKKRGNRGGFDCDAAQVNVGSGALPFHKQYKPDWWKGPIGNNTAAVCFKQ